MKPYLDELGYRLHPFHYVKVYAQGSRKLLYEDRVVYNPEFEKTLKRILLEFRGLSPITPPSEWKCKFCPKYVKEKCPLRQRGFP